MAPPDRSLIPRDSSGGDGLATSNVVGVLPPRIHALLTSGTTNTPRRGRVDDHGSGLSFLHGPLHGSAGDGDGGANGRGATIAVWEHATHTPHEDLAPPPGPVWRLVHPEHGPDDHGGGAARELLVACVGPDAPAATRDRAAALRHVYAASPATGVVGVWVLDPTNNVRGQQSQAEVTADCDASVRLPLAPKECLTAMEPLSGGGNGVGGNAWLLAATSRGRVWKIYLTGRPVTLHAKLVRGTRVADAASAEGEGAGAGIVRGLYNYFTTPSKTSRSEAAARDEATNGAVDEDIVALVPLPPLSNEGKVPTQGPAASPHKQQRVSGTYGVTRGALSLTSSLVLTEWRISLSTGANENEEGYMARKALFPRRPDGTLALDALANASGASGLDGYTRIDVVALPSLARDGRSLLVAVRIEKANDAEAARMYVLSVAVAGELSVVDAAWLGRYAGASISSVGGSLECAGLVAGDAEGDAAPAGGMGGATAYVVVGPRGVDVEHPFPVTVSAMNFSAATGQGPAAPPRGKDMDLATGTVPSVVGGSVGYDAITGGCVFMATVGLLGGATVRFPPLAPGSMGARDASMEEGGRMDEAVLNDEAVLTIKSHLTSAFRQHLNKAAGHSARAAIPPSVGTCSSHVLTAAVVLASRDYACAIGGGGASSPFSPKAPVTVLRDKLRHHKEFVNFLAHGGAYRRVTAAGRTALRDQGERIAAARALLTGCQAYFARADAAAGDEARRGEVATMRQRAMGALEGTSDDVMALHEKWTRLQRLAVDSAGPTRDLLLLTSSSICRGINQALEYRQEESGPLYDIPDRESSSYSSWTSSAEVLGVLSHQLEAISQNGESVLSSSSDIDADRASLRQYVEDLAAAALSGHKEAVQHKPEDAAAMKSYEDAKLLSVPLLRQYANDDGDDLVALSTSLDHRYFEGIVQICHDHRGSWRQRGPFSDKEADATYDLRPMLANASSDSPYSRLHELPDYRTGLHFCAYVFRWYADRGLYPEVFELGKNCPHDLMRYVRNDDRLSHLSWVQHLRVGAHEQATVGLLGLASPSESMGLWEKDQMMSLAKLSNKLASARGNRTVATQRNDLIDNSLTLISAQRILQEEEFGDEVALNADDLLRLACEKIQSAGDIDEIKRFGICGLAVSSAKPLDQSDAMASDASQIWLEVIQADSHTWQSVAKEHRTAVGGISEEELIQRVEGTAFVAVMDDYVTNSPSGSKMQHVGFSDRVRNTVMHSLGSDELADVLKLSADIVVAAN